MLRCVSRRTLPCVVPGCARASARIIPVAVAGRHRNYATAAAPSLGRLQFRYRPDRLKVFRKVEIPKVNKKDPNNSAYWIGLLEPALPPHLRDHAFRHATSELEVVEIAELIIGAQWLSGFNFLNHLGTAQGRWRALVWLSKLLIEAFASQRPLEYPLQQLTTPWDDTASLIDLTGTDEGIVLPEAEPSAGTAARIPSLNTLTGESEVLNSGRRERLSHDVFGHIWRSLGFMTVQCAKNANDGLDAGVMQPEILEIIAIMHHNEVMPTSIYNFTLSEQSSALQQPPTLNLFSSRIMTSLSDAAWRAHERAILEEAQAKGAKYAALHPEIPGSAYRLHVGGLTPEVWLELILWTCLHGGWISDGAVILSLVERRRWATLSWRDHMHALDPDARSGSADWGRLGSLLQSKRSGLDDNSHDGPSIRKTISSEIVNNFLNAIVMSVRVGVGDRGMPFRGAIGHIRNMRNLLRRSDLSLGASTWDATLLGIIESGGIDLDEEPNLVDRLSELIPHFGGEVQSINTGRLPAYMLDGSAILVGLLHRALQAQIRSGDIRAALTTFATLQQWADANKLKSLEDFFANKQSSESTPQEPKPLFDSHFSGIDYPSFNVQIPPEIMARFLQLVMDSDAYDFGKWLIYSDDVDGAVISESMYQDTLLKPALVRFAIETMDKALLTKVVGTSITDATTEDSSLRARVLQSFLDTQVAFKRWQLAERTLAFITDSPDVTWSLHNLASLLRTMIEELPGAQNGEEEGKRNFATAGRLLRDMLEQRFGKGLDTNPATEDERRGLLQVKCLFLILSSLSPQWSKWCMRTSHNALESWFVFNLPLSSFNVVLSGILQSHGSVAARRVIGIFWPHAIRDASALLEDQAGVARMTRHYQRDGGFYQRKFGYRFPGLEGVEATIYGGLRPNIGTLRLILAKCVQEVREDMASQPEASKSEAPAAQPPKIIPTGSLPPSSPQPLIRTHSSLSLRDRSGDRPPPDLTPTGMLTWSLHCLRRLRMSTKDLRAEVLNLLQGPHELQKFRERVPDVEELFVAERYPGDGSEIMDADGDEEGMLEGNGVTESWTGPLVESEISADVSWWESNGMAAEARAPEEQKATAGSVGLDRDGAPRSESSSTTEKVD